MEAHHFRWDLDKTYLQTDFESLRGLYRAATEPAEDKSAYPGAAELLAALGTNPHHQIAIVSGSPTSMRRVLTEKLDLDGVRVDHLVLKPQMHNILRLRFRAIRDQIGYKLPTLLSWRSIVDVNAQETLVGDDVEMDAFIYVLYAEIVAGRIDTDALVNILEQGKVHRDAIERSVHLAKLVHSCEGVSRVLVHLDKRTAPGWFRPYGYRLVPFHNYLQAAAVLFVDGRIELDTTIEITRSIVRSGHLSVRSLAGSLEDLGRRMDIEPPKRKVIGDGLDQAFETTLFSAALIQPGANLSTSLTPVLGLDALLKREQSRHRK